MTTVELSGLAKSFPGQKAVDSLDLTVRSGELLVLVGPSGSGKSTTLRLIAGLETPDAGTIRFGDRPVTELAARRRDVAMVFQDYALYPHMTVRQNLAFGLKMRGLSSADIRQRTERTAATLELQELLDRKPGQLSGGQQQRVAVGRAIVREPSVFLLDEPLSNLDARLRDDMRVELVRLHRQLGTTMIYVTHDQTEAMMMGQRVAVMDRGRILQVAAPMDLYCHPQNRFVATFIGTPAMNRISVARVDGRWKTGDHVWPHPGKFAEALRHPIDIGVRPAAFRFRAAGSDDIRLQLTVDVVQPLGESAVLQCSWQSQRLSVLHPIRRLPSEGQSIECYVSPQDIYYFDVQDGRNLQLECSG